MRLWVIYSCLISPYLWTKPRCPNRFPCILSLVSIDNMVVWLSRKVNIMRRFHREYCGFSRIYSGRQGKPFMLLIQRYWSLRCIPRQGSSMWIEIASFYSNHGNGLQFPVHYIVKEQRQMKPHETVSRWVHKKVEVADPAHTGGIRGVCIQTHPFLSDPLFISPPSHLYNIVWHAWWGHLVLEVCKVTGQC